MWTCRVAAYQMVVPTVPPVCLLCLCHKSRQAPNGQRKSKLKWKWTSLLGQRAQIKLKLNQANYMAQSSSSSFYFLWQCNLDTGWFINLAFPIFSTEKKMTRAAEKCWLRVVFPRGAENGSNRGPIRYHTCITVTPYDHTWYLSILGRYNTI